jgi:integrase
MGERVKLTESAVANLEARLEAQGRDLGKSADVWDAELKGLVLRREASGHKGWHLRIHVNGRRSKVKLGDWPALSVVEARKAAKVAAAKVAKGDDPVAERIAKRQAEIARRSQAKRDSAAVLGTFIEGEYKTWAERHLRGRNRQETVAAIQRNFRAWWGRPMDSITPLDVERWRRERLKAGVARTTVNREWGRLRAALGKAQEWGVIGAPVKVKRLALAGDEGKRIRYLTAEERARLLAALDARELRRREERARMILWQRERGLDEFAPHGAFTDHLKPLTLLVLNTGLRRGEALGLTWAAIDLARSMIHVHAATSKSGQSRDIPITADLRRLLETWHEQQKPTDVRSHVFQAAEGERLQSIGRQTWLDLMAAAKIKDFRFHDLRHDYASRLVMAGVDLYSVSKLLGHSNVEMTQRYAHLAPDYLRAAVRKLEQVASVG